MKQWIQNLKEKFRKTSLSLNTDIHSTLTAYERVLRSLDKEIVVPTGILFSTKIDVFYPNIEKYTQEIKTMIKIMDNDRMIPQTMIPLDYHRVTLEGFFIDSKAHYMDIAQSINEFKAVCLDWIQRLQVDSSSSQHHFNQRVSLGLAQNMMYLIQTIRSHSISM